MYEPKGGKERKYKERVGGLRPFWFILLFSVFIVRFASQSELLAFGGQLGFHLQAVCFPTCTSRHKGVASWVSSREGRRDGQGGS